MALIIGTRADKPSGASSVSIPPPVVLTTSRAPISNVRSVSASRARTPTTRRPSVRGAIPSTWFAMIAP
jgi:hypothetical protein